MLSVSLVLGLSSLLPSVELEREEGAAAMAPIGTDTWQQWRGPTRDGQFHGELWPTTLGDDELSLRWRLDDLGESYATPVVTESMVYTVGSTEEGLELVRALDRATGEEVWRHGWAGKMTVPFFAAKNGSWIRSSPAFDGESLFVAGMRDVLVCLDGATGEVRWTVDFVEREGSRLPDFGFVCSPLVTDDHVYVQAGDAFAKLDKRTGETVWKAMEGAGGMDSQFSSPILTTMMDKEQLVILTRTTLAGIDPADGGVLWQRDIESFRGMNILTPLDLGDAIFTAPYGGRTQLLTFEAGEEGVQIERAWTSRSQGYMCSPVLVDGHVYYFSRSNRFVCVDAATGDDAWISAPTGDDYWSIVAQEDRILALSDSGILRLVAADPTEYRVLAERELEDVDSTWAHLAVVDGALFVRELTSLLAFDWRRSL